MNYNTYMMQSSIQTNQKEIIKMKTTAKILAVLMALVMALSFAACSGNSSSEQLIMATNAEFPPYEYYEGGDIIGIDVEIAQAIAGKLGKALVIEDMAFDSICQSVKSGKADIGLAA